jgi:CubicO group peptidase (beta-lactamase class C family)
MTFSVTKSFLGLLAAIALDDGLIGSIDDRAADYALDDSFTTAQNDSITWRHLLEQTSEWQGTLWSKPDQVDHFRAVGGGDNSRKGELRALQPPGTYWEYNDVRVNRLSHLLLEVFKRPLPEVLRDRIMSPIGASDTWSWNAYHNAWLDLDGKRLASVPGGGHWGGGLFINSEDLALVANLVKGSGRCGTEQIISPTSLDLLLEPAVLNPVYGKLWWLNTDRKYYPSAPASSVFAVGAGTNLVWIDRQLDLVAVARWISPKAVDGFITRVVAAIDQH